MRLPAPLRTLAYAALAGGLLLTASCRKTAESPDEDITTAQDRSDDNAETAISAEAMRGLSPAQTAGVSTTTNPEAAGTDYVSSDADFQARFGTCATRTYSAASRILLIDFGPTNCLCPDGRYRRGQIQVQFTTESGTTRRSGAIVTRNNYFVNNNQHTATRIFTDLGNGSFSVSVPNASIIYANNGGTHSWTASWTFTRTAGYPTPSILDDVYKVTGSAQGTNRKGLTYTTLIRTELVKRGDCLKYYVHGTLVNTNSNGRELLLDYDPTNTQACDNTASVTVNGRTYTITLK